MCRPDNFFLLNPTTHEYAQILDAPASNPILAYGFGYVSSIDAISSWWSWLSTNGSLFSENRFVEWLRAFSFATLCQLWMRADVGRIFKNIKDFVCLPERIIQLSNLHYLYLGGCTQLQMLPKLPGNIIIKSGIWFSAEYVSSQLRQIDL